MAIPIQYIPEDRTAIARAQIAAEMAKTNASMWQTAQDSALKERLAQQGLEQAGIEQRSKEALFDKEAALRQNILNQELGARTQEAAASRRAEMEKFRMARMLQEQEPQTQLAREQLGVYKNLTPEERRNKALGVNPEEEKRNAERFAFEQAKFAEQTRQAKEAAGWEKGKFFSQEAAKGTFSSEDADKAWIKTRTDISKNPLLSNVKNQLGMFADVVASAPGMAPFERYLSLARENYLKEGVTLPDEEKKVQGQTLWNLLGLKEQQIVRSEAELEKYRLDPDMYATKLMQLEQSKADYTRLKASTVEFLKELKDRKETSWWDTAKNVWSVGQDVASITSAGSAAPIALWYKMFGNKNREGEK